jgi:hypothetical protein
MGGAPSDMRRVHSFPVASAALLHRDNECSPYQVRGLKIRGLGPRWNARQSAGNGARASWPKGPASLLAPPRWKRASDRPTRFRNKT